jgi:hypothetical protein
MKIRPVGAELFRADRQTKMTKLAVAFRNFANGLKNRKSHLSSYDDAMFVTPNHSSAY